jgi:hypothetical protein
MESDSGINVQEKINKKVMQFCDSAVLQLMESDSVIIVNYRIWKISAKSFLHFNAIKIIPLI